MNTIEAGILVFCIAMFYLKLFGVNISWWFIFPPMIAVIIYIVITAYIRFYND